MNIKMVDLHRQYLDIKSDIDNAIQDTINNTAFIRGSSVKEFEEKLANYLGVQHVIACANGTDALQLAIMALGLQPGDEIITPNFTFIATVEVVALLGLKPIMVDVDEDLFTMDIAQLKKAITPKTKAIIPVHLFGQCANMDAIMEIANENQLYVIEDTAQALGADFISSSGAKSKAGTIGDIGTTSFFPSKNLGCYGDGGALFTNNTHLAETIRAMANHGMREKYKYSLVGINSRLDTIQAAILLQKLPLLDDYNKARYEAAQFYSQILSNNKKIHVPAEASYSSHIYHQYTLKLDGISRDQVKTQLAEKNIPTMIYYPYPLHSQEAYLEYFPDDIHFEVTEKLCTQVISLPMHTHLSTEELIYITENLIHICNE
jgi:UDP-2-acetamido-2-deoxy-ribo-hexuluronate aminotransferase